jgi:Enoyl-CoA hydratase/carnithine racemase
MDVAKQMAARIEAGAPLAIQESRKVARRAVEDSESAAWDCTDEAWEVVLSSDDYREGVAAFTEKRDPEWTGS